MDCWEFCREVGKHIPRATKAEQSAIRRELQDHVMDAALMLEEGGCSPDDSVERAVARMGDPAEIGQALNAQLSPFWLWLGRGSLLLAAGICALLLVNQDRARWTVKNLVARFAPVLIWGEMREYTPGYEYSEKIDLRIDLGEDVIHFHQVYLDEDGEESRAGVWGIAYSKDIHGYEGAAAPWYTYLRANLCAQGETEGSSAVWVDNGAIWLSTAVRPGDSGLTLSLEAYGERREWSIPLPKEVGK